MRKEQLMTRTQDFTNCTLYLVSKSNPVPTPIETAVWGTVKTPEEAVKSAREKGLWSEGIYTATPEGATPVFALVGSTFDKLLVWNLVEAAKVATVTEPRNFEKEGE